jgi:hypothetical protein
MAEVGGEFPTMKGLLLLAMIAVGSVLAGLPLAGGSLAADDCCDGVCSCEDVPAVIEETEEAESCCVGEDKAPEGPVLKSMCGCGGHGPALVHVLGDSFRCPVPQPIAIAAFREVEGELSSFQAPAVSQRPLPEPPPPRA